jgi:uncharacterized membrane protein YbhN (UPF0104 family)
MVKSAIKTLLKLLFVATALFLVFKKIDIKSTLELMERINPWIFGLAILSSLISFIISSLRSNYYFASFGLKISYKYMLFLYFIGAFFNLALPGGIGGDVYKIYHIHRRFDFPKLKAFRVTLYERVNGFFVLCLIGFVLFYFSSFEAIPYASYVNTTLFMLITPCYIFGIKYVLKDKPNIAFWASWYSLFLQLFQMVMAVLLVYALAPNSTINIYMDFTLLFIVASILAIVPVTIGGIGIRELTLLYGLDLLSDSENIMTLGVAFALSSFLVYAITAFIGLPLCYMIKSVDPNLELSPESRSNS